MGGNGILGGNVLGGGGGAQQKLKVQPGIITDVLVRFVCLT